MKITEQIINLTVEITVKANKLIIKITVKDN